MKINQMNLAQLLPVVTAATFSLSASSAQAFGIAGNSSYTPNGSLIELSVSNEVLIPDEAAEFTVSNPDALDIGSLFLEASLEDFGVADDGVYAPVSSYISGFQFLGEDAVFNLNAGQNVFVGLLNGNYSTIDSELTGNITALDGSVLGTAVGSFSSIQTNNQARNFTIELERTPFNLDGAEPTAVPDPSLLFGLVSVAVTSLWKYRGIVSRESAIGNRG